MKMIQLRSKKFVSMLAALIVVLFGIMANGCSDKSGSGDSLPTVVAPGVPTNFVVVGNTGGQDLSATLTWNVPTTGSEPASYEIYRSTTAGTVFNPDNHLISIPAVEGQISYVYFDNAELVKDVPTYWVVAAKNASGETPTPEVMYEFTSGEVDAYGNNFAAAMIFADGYGITGLKLEATKSWVKESTDPVNEIDFNTGLRPSIDQISLTEFPYYDENTTFVIGDTTYYKQQTVSTWQGEWKDGNDTEQHVMAKWGDNLISQTLSTESIVRIEMVLTKALDTNMTAYNMVHLYGSEYNEIFGTDRVEYNTTTAFVFASNARLTIQQLDEPGGVPIPGDPVEDQPLFDVSISDGPGKFAAEINVAGNLVYGYVWDLKQNPVTAGTYRITFSLDDTSVLAGTDNNTFIDGVTMPTEGESDTVPVLDSNTSVHIDITIH